MSQARPSIRSPSSSSSGNKARATAEDFVSHVITNLASLQPPVNPPMAHTKAPPSAHVERGRPIPPSSSWNSLKFMRKSSRESLVEERNDATVTRNSSVRRFQSLGFLRRKGSSISVATSPSTSSPVSSLPQSGAGSSHGHSSSNSNSSYSSHSRQPSGRVQATQAPQPSHTVPASTVFPSMSSGTTFKLTLTHGDASTAPLASNAKPAAATSFARPPKANPVARRSVSLYERSSPKADLAVSSQSNPRATKKRMVPLPPTKTTVVARTPCTYDVTALRPVRPRSSSLPLDSVVPSRSEHMVPAATTTDESLAAAAAATAAATTVAASRLNTTSQEASPFIMASSPSVPSSGRVTPSRIHHRYAAVYRPPPPVDANGYAHPGHPKAALSLSMPSGVSIIQPLPPAAAAAAAAASKSTSARNASPSSSRSTPSSSRPPPRAPLPVSPDASPERNIKPLPPVSRSFGSPSPISPLSGNPWARQRSPSIPKSPSILSNNVGEGGKVNVTYNINAGISSRASTKPLRTSSSNSSLSPSNAANIHKPNASDRSASGSARTIYSATPSIPINTNRRPSLPLTSTLQEQEYPIDQTDQLWGYFERKGLASSMPRSHSATASPATTGRELPTVTSRGAARHDAERYTQTMYLPAPVHTPQTPNFLRTPPLSGGVSPVSPLSSKPITPQHAAMDNSIPLERSSQKAQPRGRPERLRPTHLVSHSSSAALPSPSEQDTFLLSPTPSAFFGPGIGLPITPVSPVSKSWTNPKSDADSVVLPPSPF